MMAILQVLGGTLLFILLVWILASIADALLERWR